MPAEAPALLLRADAGPGIGSGHVSRLLSLAEAWTAAGGRASLLTRLPSDALRARARAVGTAVVEVPAPHPHPDDGRFTAAAIAAAGAGAWVAVDGYGFDAAYLAALRAAGARVLRVDDAPAGPVPCDALLDQNPGAEVRGADLRPEALPLLGPRWALTRPGFRAAGETREIRPAASRLLVSFGGWDPVDATSAAVRALARLRRPLEAVVVVGPDNPRAARIEGLCDGRRVRVDRAADMPALMAWADAALLGGGVTTLEALAAGLPFATATVAANQEEGARVLGERGLSTHLGRATDLSDAALAAGLEALLGASRETRASRAAAGRAAVDGRGAARVAAVLLALTQSKLDADWVALRPAAADDALEVWRIANEPAVRANSFHGGPIPLAEHLRWYDARLGRADERFWILDVGGAVAGQVRYAMDGDAAEVHFSVRGAFRGKGLGTVALAATRGRACRELGARRLTGVVIVPNPASERAFASAGWSRAADVTRDGKTCAVFEAPCS